MNGGPVIEFEKCLICKVTQRKISEATIRCPACQNHITTFVCDSCRERAALTFRVVEHVELLKTRISSAEILLSKLANLPEAKP
jgi:uncharacterized protein YlaI